jgi:hypothetical protein
MLSFNKFCKIENGQGESLDQSVERINFVRKVQGYLGGNSFDGPNSDNLQIKESISKIISYNEDRAPLDCIYDNEPLGFEKSDH